MEERGLSGLWVATGDQRQRKSEGGIAGRLCFRRSGSGLGLGRRPLRGQVQEHPLTAPGAGSASTAPKDEP